MAKKVVIIGAGIAGLAAACYARMNGYDAEIYEMHDKPGGLCTSWKRQGYTIDGCIHWLTGSTPQNNFHKLWREVGAVQGRRMVDHEVFYRYADAEGRQLVLYCDADRLEKHLKEISPEDAPLIEKFCRLVRRFSRFQMPMDKAPELYGLLDVAKLMAKMLPIMGDFKYTTRITIGEFARQFKSSFLREIFPVILWDGGYSLMGLVFTLGLLNSGDGGYPIGGSLEFAKAIERRCLELGGSIAYKSRVEKILEEDGKAVGIRLADGREVRGDYVIAAADLKTVLYDMLDGRHVDPMHERLFREFKTSPSMVQIAFGVNMDFSGHSDALGDFYRPQTIKDDRFDWIMVRNYSCDPTVAPPGKSVVVAGFISDDYDYWAKLAEDKAAYNAEKERLVAMFADELELKYPGFKNAIEMTDVATPVTFARYTGNWKGTFMTWIIPPDRANEFRVIPKTVPGLADLWLAGMWVEPPGGLPGAVMSGRNAIQVICRGDKQRFQTSVPLAGAD